MKARPTGTKLFTGSKGSDRDMAGMVPWVMELAKSSV